MPPPRWSRQPRTLGGAWSAIEEIRERIDGMQLADEVAAKVKHEIEAHRMVGFSLIQKVIGAAVGAIAVADFVLSIVHASGHH